MLQDAFAALSNQNGIIIASRAVALTQNPTPDYERGRDNATKIFLYFIDRLPNEDSDPDVQSAKTLTFDLTKKG